MHHNLFSHSLTEGQLGCFQPIFNLLHMSHFKNVCHFCLYSFWHLWVCALISWDVNFLCFQSWETWGLRKYMNLLWYSVPPWPKHALRTSGDSSPFPLSFRAPEVLMLWFPHFSFLFVGPKLPHLSLSYSPSSLYPYFPSFFSF